jgi:hypothetical protein
MVCSPEFIGGVVEVEVGNARYKIAIALKLLATAIKNLSSYGEYSLYSRSWNL